MQDQAAPGDLVFLPQGSFHYFENANDDEDLTALTIFNTSAEEPKDDIGLVAALNALPREVLTTVFGASADLFTSLPP